MGGGSNPVLCPTHGHIKVHYVHVIGWRLQAPIQALSQRDRLTSAFPSPVTAARTQQQLQPAWAERNHTFKPAKEIPLYSRTSNNGHCRGIQILSVIGGVC
jgi:hypothetical protein